MKLDYKILWLDDKIEEFIEDEYIEEIKNYLLSYGFIPKIVTVDNSNDFFAKLNNSYDLILTDYHMNGMNGDDVVKTIRSKEYSVMTEILFYTAKADLKDTQKISRVSFLETNSTTSTHSEGVVSFTKQLIDLTIKKFQHIVTMRGMIMNETSTIDAQMIKIINKTINSEMIDFSELSNAIYNELIGLFSRKKDFIVDCKEKDNFNKLSKDSFVFSAKYKIQTLSQITRALKVVDFSSDYEKEINLIRNKFAHAILMKRENGNEYFMHGESGIEFNEDLCKKIRKDINKHKNNLDNLEKVLEDKLRLVTINLQ